MIQPGQTAGRFEILSHLGAGGMGEVYRARDPRLGRDVALKILPSHLLNDRERLVRFAQEARTASLLNHPNIVTIYEIGQVEGLPFIAMELIEGATLRAVIASGTLPVRRVLQIAAQLADGLAKAHAAGLVHRDLKPENVMVTKDGFVKVLDFGIAKLSAPDGVEAQGAALTQTGLVLGTPGYMSPEQAKGLPLDARSDQFSFGLLLYELLTGRRAFQRDSPVQTMSAVIQEEPEPIETLAPKTPLPLRWIVERCLEKDPESRFASTQDLARDLHNLRERAAQLVSPPGGTESLAARTAATGGAGHRYDTSATRPLRSEEASSLPEGAPPKRARWQAGNVLLGLLLTGAGAGIGYWIHDQQAGPPPVRFVGEVLLSGSTRVFGPQISPDGTVLAFITPVKGILQVAVMKPESGDWAILTKEAGRGNVKRIAWSRDGTRILFDRVSDHPAGIFSVPVLGGEERLVLESGQAPDTLPDGTLVTVALGKEGDFRFARVRPGEPRPVPVGPRIAREFAGLAYRPFPDGVRILFYGSLHEGSSPRGSPRRAYLLDLASGKAEPFAPSLPLVPPLTISADGKKVLAALRTGDMVQIVRISLSGDAIEPLLSLPGGVAYICERAGGDLFVGMLDRSGTLLRFPLEGGNPEAIAGDSGGAPMHPLQLADGRLLVPSVSAGRRRLLAGGPGEALRPFLEGPDQSGPPVAAVGADSVAFLTGPPGGGAPSLALASARDGRILRRFEETAGMVPQSLTVGTDARSLFFAEKGQVLEQPVAGGAPRSLCAGDGVAADPESGGLIVQRNGTAGVELFRRTPDGAETPILVAGDLLPSALPISGRAAGADGRILLTATPRGGWTSVAALLDPRAGSLSPIPVLFPGDVYAPVWSPDGRVLAVGSGSRSELWLFRVKGAAKGAAPAHP
jgi:eukaryotic-like serine/threonine-protein kinase